MDDEYFDVKADPTILEITIALTFLLVCIVSVVYFLY